MKELEHLRCVCVCDAHCLISAQLFSAVVCVRVGLCLRVSFPGSIADGIEASEEFLTFFFPSAKNAI